MVLLPSPAQARFRGFLAAKVIVLTLTASGLGIVSAAPVDVDPTGEAQGDLVAVSVFGNASTRSSRSDGWLAASAFGDSEGGPYAVSGTGDARANLYPISLTGTCTTDWDEYDVNDPAAEPIRRTQTRRCFVVSTNEDAEARYAAFSRSGNASGEYLAVSEEGDTGTTQGCNGYDAFLVGAYGCGDSPPFVAASGTGNGNGGALGLSGTGDGTAHTAAVTVLGNASQDSEFGAAVTATGSSQACRTALDACVALSIFGSASGDTAISLFGAADGDRAISGCEAAGSCWPELFYLLP